MTSMFLPVEHLRWNGQPVLRAHLNLDAAVEALPLFERGNFGDGSNANPELHAIIRRPWHDDARSVPVAVASRHYVLVQHPHILRNIADALQAAHVELDGNSPGVIDMSPLGERVECRFRFRGLSFDPGDGHPLHLQLFLRNSVDGSHALEISVRWLRQVCSNGMCVLTAEDRLREIHHRERFDIARISDFLGERTQNAVRQQRQLRDWARRPVPADHLLEWVRDDVRAAWGPYAAIRTFHICNTGLDGLIDVQPGKKLPPLQQIALRKTRPVPGAIAPAKSLYAVYQALTWIADHRSNLEERETWGKEALTLLDKLEARTG